MSVHSEVNNLLKNRSGNALIQIRGRRGDVEDGDEYFSMVASKDLTPYETLEKKDEGEARKEFLSQFFCFLKEHLNKIEFEFVKQLFVEGQSENTVLKMLGLSQKNFKTGLLNKLSKHREDLFELVEQSEWEDAELFARCFLSAPNDIKDVNLKNYLPKTVKGFGNLIERLTRFKCRKLYQAGWYQNKRDINFKVKCMTSDLFKQLKSLLRLLSPVCMQGVFEGFNLKIIGESKERFLELYGYFINQMMTAITDFEERLKDAKEMTINAEE